MRNVNCTIALRASGSTREDQRDAAPHLHSGCYCERCGCPSLAHHSTDSKPS